MLAERPPHELQRLREKMSAERTKLTDEMARLDLELEQVDEALARQARRRGVTMQVRKGPTTQDLVLALLRRVGPTGPTDIFDALQADGFQGSISAVYNALRKLQDKGDVRKDDDSSLYEAASRNGSAPAEAPAGPSENGESGGTVHDPAQLHEGLRLHSDA